MNRHLSRLCFLLVAFACIHLSAGRAAAQSSFYVTGSGFADVKRFSSAGYSGGGDLNAIGPGGGIRVGTFVAPKWTVELAVDAAAKTRSTYKNPITLAIYPALPNPDLTATNQFASVGAIVGFHPQTQGTVRLAYLAGYSFLRSEYTSASVTGVSQPQPDVLPVLATTFVRVPEIRYSGGFTLGFEASIALSKRVALVPEIRAVAFSTTGGGASGFLIRPGVGLRWSL